MRTLILLIMSLLVATAGCIKNPFSTRSGQEPAGMSGTWETPASPEIALRNLIFAYNEKVIQNYQSCLADDFVFSATEDSIEAEAQGNGYIFYGWDKSVEVSTTENIFSTFNVSGNNLFLILNESPDFPDSVGDTSAVLYRDYMLTIIVDETIGADTTLAEGLATFRLSRTGFNWWSVYFWSDLPSAGNDDSWGKFKAGYRR